jgi:signal transduction histidine kinase
VERRNATRLSCRGGHAPHTLLKKERSGDVCCYSGARRGIAQLGETVDELLDLTRLEAGRLTLSADAVDIGAIVKEVAQRSQPRVDELGLRLVVGADEPLPAVAGDRARLRIVVDNIVNDALKYAASGGEVRVPSQLHFAIVISGGGGGGGGGGGATLI